MAFLRRRRAQPAGNGTEQAQPSGPYSEYSKEDCERFCLFHPKSRLLEYAAVLLTQCEDLRAELAEERRRGDVPAGGVGLGLGVNNPIFEGAGDESGRAAAAPAPRPVLRQAASNVGRQAAERLGPLNAQEAWDILQQYQMPDGGLCLCHEPAIAPSRQAAEARRQEFKAMPPEARPPDAALYGLVLDMYLVMELIDDEEYDPTAGHVDGARRWTCRPRFNRIQGGAGSSPLLQCIMLSTEASLLAARYILKVWPGCVLDVYAWRPPGSTQLSPFEGESILHLAIVKRIPRVLLFIERFVPRGHLKLRYLANHAATTGRFFAPGSAAYYGSTPLHFAAGTGAAFWFFLYLVRRLDVNIDAPDPQGNSALHFAVLHCKNESYRFLRTLGAAESGRRALNHSLLTPLQLAIKQGGRCTQAPVVVKPGEDMLAQRPDLLPISLTNQTMPAFISKLSEEVRWTFGSVKRVKFPVTEILLGNVRNDANSGLRLCVQNWRTGPALLCPPGSLEFLVAAPTHFTGFFEFLALVLGLKERSKPLPDGADLPESMVFRMPNKPGVRPPPVETILMLLFCERAWQRFGRNLLLLEFIFHLLLVGVLSFVSMDRISPRPMLTRNLVKGTVVDAILLLQSTLMLALQLAKRTSLRSEFRPERVRESVQRTIVVAKAAISTRVTGAKRFARSARKSVITSRLGRLTGNRVHPNSTRSPAPGAASPPHSPNRLSAYSPDDADSDAETGGAPSPPTVSRGRHRAQFADDTVGGDGSALALALTGPRAAKAAEDPHPQVFVQEAPTSSAPADGRDWITFFYDLMAVFVCCLAITACAIRFWCRAIGWARHPEWAPADAELLAIASWLGYIVSLYYLRCFRHIGTTSIILIQMLVDDVAKILSLFCVLLVGFSIAFQVLLFAGCPESECLDGSWGASVFSNMPKSLLTTVMLSRGERQTVAFGKARTPALSRFVSIVFVIVVDVLIGGLIIGSLSKTMRDVSDNVQQKQILQRTQCMLYLERILPESFRDYLYGEFLELRVQKDEPQAAAGGGGPGDAPGTACKARMLNAAGEMPEEIPQSSMAHGDVVASGLAPPPPRAAKSNGFLQDYALSKAELGRLKSNAFPRQLHNVMSKLDVDVVNAFVGDTTKTHKTLFMYVDQTTIDDSDGVPAANKPVTRIMGQDSRDFDTYWARLGRDAKKEQAVRATPSGSSDWRLPSRRRAQATAAQDEADVQASLEAFLVRHGGEPIGFNDILLVLDVQNDFLERDDWELAACPVTNAGRAVNFCNGLIKLFESRGAIITFTQDSHPRGHTSFAGTQGITIRPGEPYPTRTVWYGSQVLYPDHAVQGTVGSHFVRDLEVPNSSVVVRKGRRKHVDTHSAFFESDRCTSTGLLEVIHKLRRRRGGIGRMFMAGLGYDTIVRYTAEDALLLVAGLEQQHANGWSRVFVVEEATGFVTREGAAKAKMALEAMGVTSVNTVDYAREHGGIPPPTFSTPAPAARRLDTLAEEEGEN